MLRSIWQQWAAVLLVLIFLGPTATSVLHHHDAHQIDLCTAKEEQHFHTYRITSPCFTCSFSFSTFRADAEAVLDTASITQAPAAPDAAIAGCFSPLIPADHIPRGPPVDLR